MTVGQLTNYVASPLNQILMPCRTCRFQSYGFFVTFWTFVIWLLV